jgi:hypothetical protein
VTEREEEHHDYYFDDDYYEDDEINSMTSNNDQEGDYYDSSVHCDTVGYMFASIRNHLTDTDILLDNQANISVFKNKYLLINIKKASKPLLYHGQTAGKETYLTHYGD